ncbi:MAG: T9SS type A sorting domain-containing protein [Sphingobacteriales bacterium]|nr:T9SS type A sorting domain-containing protein [Sphingobacteriales bacterium]
MKFTFLCYLLLLTPPAILAQCEAGTAVAELNINNVRTPLLCGGDLWKYREMFSNNTEDTLGSYQVPKSAPQTHNAIYAGSLWISALDEYNNQHIAAELYRKSSIDGSSINDYFPGTLATNGVYLCEEFDRHWTVYGNDISDFITQFNNNLITDISQVPASIAQWPGRNNPYFSDFQLPSDKDLAPFYDTNHDQIYNPLDGDYPVVYSDTEGSYTDQMVWHIVNDGNGEHTQTKGLPLGIEVGITAFAFATDDAINNDTFYHYEVRNFSGNTYNDVSVGHYIDVDLGFYLDDFIGFYPKHQIAFSYNGDPYDEGHYKSDLPYIGFQYIPAPFSQDTSFNITRFITYEKSFSSTTINLPSEPEHYYNYLNGKKMDGSFFTDPQGNATKILYYGNPCSLTEWNEFTSNNTPHDVRMVFSSGEHYLPNGEKLDFTLAVIWDSEITYSPCQDDIFSTLEQRHNEIDAFFDEFPLDNEKITSTDAQIPAFAATNLVCSPNPFSEQIILHLNSNKTLQARLFNMLGQNVLNTTLHNNTATFHTQHLPEGLYEISIYDGKQKIITDKLLKIK